MQHHFDVDVAAKYGILEAVILNNFAYWIKHNEANGTNFHDGNYWTYNSTKALNKLFPYASERKIRYAIDHLKQEGLVVTGCYNEITYDRTTWYALTEFGKSVTHFCQMELANLSNGSGKNVTPIPNKKPNNKPNDNTDGETGGKPEKKEFVPPTLEEVKEYAQSRNSSVDPVKFYEYFCEGNWIDSKGAPVRNWRQKFITWEGRKKRGLPSDAPKPKKQFNVHYDNE